MCNNHHVCLAGDASAATSVVYTFNPSHPDGTYTLRLSIPAERTIVNQLCRLDLANNTNAVRILKLDDKPPAIQGVKRLRWPERYVSKVSNRPSQRDACTSLQVVNCRSWSGR